MDRPKSMQTRKLRESSQTPELSAQNEFAIDMGVPSKIALFVKHLQAKIILQVTEPIIIGRSISDNEAAVFLDLQLFGADDLGVSRKHLRLWSENGELFVEDLGSLNRTRLNGALLEAHRQQRIRHGDQLSLGMLELNVEFIFDFLA